MVSASQILPTVFKHDLFNVISPLVIPSCRRGRELIEDHEK